MQLALPRIQRLGATLVAISPELPDNSLSTVEKNDVTFDVLSDRGNLVARQFGIVFQLPVELRSVYRWLGVNVAEVNGDETFELPIPATYVIDRDATIRKAFVDPDYTKRTEPDEIVAALERITDNQ